MIRLCSYEDRKHCYIGVKLLALSLARHSPDVELTFWCPQPSGELVAWVADQQNVTLRIDPNLRVAGWNIKPTILLKALAEGAREAIWIDSDIIVTRDIVPELTDLEPETFLATEEMRYAPEPQGSRLRTKSLGLQVGRELQTTANSCLLRATAHHVTLLEDWNALLCSSLYQAAQRLPFHSRPIHLRGDQDILTGILGSTNHAETHLRLLRSGPDIASCMDNIGYPTIDRLRNLVRGLPPFVHAQGRKPWEEPQPLSAELSPYCHVARDYADLVGEPMLWSSPRSRIARILNRVSLGNANLRGLPLTIIRELQWLLWERRRHHRLFVR